MDSVLVMHVAEVLEFAHGFIDYEGAADYATTLLEGFPDLAAEAVAYEQRETDAATFSEHVARAVDEYESPSFSARSESS